ncbi:hypothetical protein P3S67_015170 [Capsicum chacoense]
MVEEEKVEEGEIFQDYSIEIDLKIKRYLSEFRKEFEEIVSFENLRPRFGMYGSFLPCYLRPLFLLFHPIIQSVPFALQFSSQQLKSVKLNSSINRSNREKDHLRKKYRVEHQCQAKFGMIHKQVCKFSLKKTLGYRKEVRTCTTI